MALENEDIKRRIQVMSASELEKEIRRPNIRPQYRTLLQQELNSRGGGGAIDEKAQGRLWPGT